MLCHFLTLVNISLSAKETFPMKVVKLLGLFLLLSLTLSPAFASPVRAAGQVTLLFFDRNGTQLNVSQIRSTSSNGSAGYGNDAC